MAFPKLHYLVLLLARGVISDYHYTEVFNNAASGASCLGMPVFSVADNSCFSNGTLSTSTSCLNSTSCLLSTFEGASCSGGPPVGTRTEAWGGGCVNNSAGNSFVEETCVPGAYTPPPSAINVYTFPFATTCPTAPSDGSYVAVQSIPIACVPIYVNGVGVGSYEYGCNTVNVTQSVYLTSSCTGGAYAILNVGLRGCEEPMNSGSSYSFVTCPAQAAEVHMLSSAEAVAVDARHAAAVVAAAIAAHAEARAFAAAATSRAVRTISAAAPPPVARNQLSLYACDDTRAPLNFVWSFVSGAFQLHASGLCVSYDPATTNLYADACGPAGAPLQTFTPRADGTIFHPQTGLCWDSQYYGNTSGSVLGLYECSDESWGRFAFDASSGHITNTQLTTLCVNGGGTPIPVGTPEQLAWLDNDVALMISYDMITQMPEEKNPQHFCYWAGGDSGFPLPPATTFNPSALNASNWVAAAAAAGAGYTLLVASHCSGFLQWQSNVTLPDGSPYAYTVAQATTWRGGKGDVVADYVAASKAAGVGFGFYLTWNYNYYLARGPRGQWPGPLAPGQVNVTDEEYAATMAATIEEVWTRYEGAITEVWFDGGEKNQALNDLKARLQPQAIAADGTQLPNVARLVGKESGFAPYPTWSTANGPNQDGPGDPMGSFFVPAEADTPIALEDAWFWKPNVRYRDLDTLKAVYRNTVGANALLELGVIPDDTGNIPPDQFALLQAFGDYTRACHSPTAALASVEGVVSMNVSVSFKAATIDRVLLMEDLSFGERILAFDVLALPEGGYSPSPILVASGTAIGHKRILYFSSGPLTATQIFVRATLLRDSADTPHWRAVRVYAPCAQE